LPIEIPGWRDVIILEDERTLPPDVQRALRRARAERIRASPTPEVARNVGSVLTFLDNINDLILAATILGVSVLRIIPRAHPLVRGAFTVAKALDAARVVSPLGWIGRASKRSFEESRYFDPDDHIMFADVDNPFGHANRAVGQALVLGQALETIAGVGLTLGPIVGVLNDLLYSTPLGVPFEYGYGLLSPITDIALDVIRASPLAWLGGQVYAPADHARMALATALAWQIAAPWLAASPAPRSLDTLAQRPVTLRRSREPATLDELHRLGESTTSPPRWPLAGSPANLSRQSAEGELQPRIHASLREFYDAHGATDYGQLAMGALVTTLRYTAEALTPGGRGLRSGLSPRARIFAALIEAPPAPPAELTPALVVATLDNLAGSVQASGRAIPPATWQHDALRRARATRPRSD
jgi:hypothetical protein